MKTFRPVFTLFALAIVLLPFQNCTMDGFKGAKGTGTEKSGNGDGYTGKVFVAEGLCNGAPGVSAKIQDLTEMDEPEIVRENCSDIAPKAVDPSELRMETGGEGLLYRGQSFRTDARLPRIESVLPVGKLGMRVKIKGTRLCNQDTTLDVVRAPTPARGEIPFGAGNIECSNGGDEASFDLPAVFLTETDAEPVTSMPATKLVTSTAAELALLFARVRLKNTSLDGLNSVDLLLRRSVFGQPIITSVESCGVDNGLPCLRVRGRFFGEACTINLIRAGGSAILPVTPDSCQPEDVIFHVSPNFTSPGLPPFEIELNNGLRTVTRTYTP